LSQALSRKLFTEDALFPLLDKLILCTGLSKGEVIGQVRKTSTTGNKNAISTAPTDSKSQHDVQEKVPRLSKPQPDI